MNPRRVVVTGLGAVTSLGLSFEQSWTRLLAGDNGVGPITRWDVSAFATRFGGQIPDYDGKQHFSAPDARKLDLYTQFALLAAADCLADARVDLDAVDRERFGCVLGSGIGGIWGIEQQHTEYMEKGPRRISPHFIPKIMVNAMSGEISIRHGLRGTNFTTNSACASAGHALAMAFNSVRWGESDLVLTGGSESSITPLAVGGFSNMKALSTRNDEPERASRPFDRERDGFVIGEGAGLLLLEEREHALGRGARIYAEFCGYGSTADAFHITQPREDGDGPKRAMRQAFEMAGVDAGAIDYVNAHGTSTHYNDLTESRAIRDVLGAHADDVAVSSTKSMIGHLLGGSAAIEAAVTCRSIADQIVHPTRNHEHPGEGCDLDYVPGEARPTRVRAAISNSLGFGGHNTCLLFTRHDDG